MHQVADVEVAKNIMDANKKLADKNLKNLEQICWKNTSL